jgi:mRNA interferase RelE/StbE
MTAYEIRLKGSAAKELEDVPRKDRAKIVAKIQALATNPRPAGSEKLTAAECYRIRHGNYRVLYEINDHAIVVTVIRVAHRREVYR